jgi:hypothetical protein
MTMTRNNDNIEGQRRDYFRLVKLFVPELRNYNKFVLNEKIKLPNMEKSVIIHDWYMYVGHESVVLLNSRLQCIKHYRMLR